MGRYLGRWFFNFLAARTSNTLARLTIFLAGVMLVCTLALAITGPLCYYQHIEIQRLRSLTDKDLLTCEDAHDALLIELEECNKDLRTVTKALLIDE